MERDFKINAKKSVLISIIIPVYNTEKYLNKCLNSVCQQTYNEMEIIAVNDGSTDNSLDVLLQYAEHDTRVKIINQKNAGVSAARKAGLECASGSYVMFVDSDDWIDENTIECCVNKAIEDHADCVLFSYIREYPHSSLIQSLFDSDFSYDFEESEYRIHRRIIGPCGDELQHPEKLNCLDSMCMKLYKREIALKGRFEDIKTIGSAEDTIFNVYAFENCKTSYINQCFYHYRKDNTQSITSQYKIGLPEKWDVLYQMIQEYIDVSQKNDVYYTALFNRVACGMIGLGLNEIYNNAGIFSQARHIKDILNKPLYIKSMRQLNTKMCPIKWKVFFKLCKLKMGFSLTLLLHVIDFLRSRVKI